jgi:hypothetical protein
MQVLKITSPNPIHVHVPTRGLAHELEYDVYHPLLHQHQNQTHVLIPVILMNQIPISTTKTTLMHYSISPLFPNMSSPRNHYMEN